MSALDMDIGAVFKKLLSRGQKTAGASKPDGASQDADSGEPGRGARFKLPALLIAGILGLASFVYFYYLPQHRQVQEMRSKVEQLPDLSREIADLSLALNKSQAKLMDARQRYEELTRLFHTERELEDLYRHISTIALTNGLTITGINRQKEMPVYEASNAKAKGVQEGAKAGAGQGAQVAYYRVPMKVDFSGPYLNYIRFRAGLAAIKKLVNIDFETIRVVTSEGGKTGVNINAVISTYRMPEQYMNLSTEQ